MSAGDNNGGVAVQGKVSLEAAIGQFGQTLKDGLDKIHQFMTQNPRQSPLVRWVGGSVVSDGSTYVFIDLGGPTGGRIWDLRRLAVLRTALAAGGAADAFTQPANVIAGLSVRSAPPPNVGAANATGVTDWIDVASSANTPYRNTWSAHEATIRAGQRFVVVIKATTTSDQYFAAGQAEEYLESQPEVIVT